jgi:Uma2 family endonuclease
MRAMSLEASTEVLQAVEHLPNGATLVIHEFSWDDYERLLEKLGNRPGLRISYDSGRLEVVSPSSPHGWYESLIRDFVLIYCEVFHVRLEGAGIVTWKRRSLSKGVEPDASFYFCNAKHLIEKENTDLEQDPPPDVVVEVDVTNSSLGKFPIYAALGIPEVWRYHRKACRFYVLADGKYNEITFSSFLPKLTGEMLADAIEIGRSKNQDEARKAFRRRMKALKKKQP